VDQEAVVVAVEADQHVADNNCHQISETLQMILRTGSGKVSLYNNYCRKKTGELVFCSSPLHYRPEI
jgi:hypothetical protein